MVVYDFEHDAPVAFYTFDDTIPVQIYSGDLQIDMKDLQAYLEI